ncbi:hypothetical protein VTN00DRAFT_7196 [Thermoascus crustaceus]|uniref:uncharacterized protein n=1 Tax=Thermoascus crustaceus TaxID=5088 RepID=UPI0037427CD1
MTGDDPSLEELDSEISAIRAEIRNLQRRRSFLTAGLLSSDYIQKHIRKQTASTERARDISPLVLSAGKHTESNHYRVAFSATSFPYTDPSPHSDSPNLLGVRIDVCGRDGRFTQPYYVLLRREKGEGKRLRVHRHTIPAFISMEKLERRYLPRGPQTDDDDGEHEGLKPWKAKKQDLPGLVRQLRQELVSWHLRRDTVEWLNERLGLSRHNAPEEGGFTSTEQEAEAMQAKRIGIVSVSPTSLEARYVRVEWEDGRVGRFKISNNGIVERAVVIGDNGRDKSLEDAMTGGDGRVETIFDRLAQRASSES